MPAPGATSRFGRGAGRDHAAARPRAAARDRVRLISGPRPAVARLAPTPSGLLHLGNATAFAAAWLSARTDGGELLLRIEDIDTTRARAAVEEALREDLMWLGLHWDREVPRQSSRSYEPALATLAPWTYRCTCTRRMIRDAGGVYPGTCRDAGHAEGALRLRLPEGTRRFVDRRWGPQEVVLADLGDPVLVRRDGVVSYTLAVVADDLLDGVTEVVRGADLLEVTAVQSVLWERLGAPEPTWTHAPVILGPDDRKLSKSHASLGIAALRDAGWSPDDVWRVVLPWLGLDAASSLHDAVGLFDASQMCLGPLHAPELTSPGPPPPR